METESESKLKKDSLAQPQAHHSEQSLTIHEMGFA